MVEKLVRYPDIRIKNVSADVRLFDKELYELLQNMKDTMDEHSLDELSAIELAYPSCVVVLKNEDETFFEIINPRIISMKEPIEVEEFTGYYPNISASLTRYNQINLIYQDREGYQHALKCEGTLAHTIQKQVDYTFGGTFMDKLPKKSQQRLEKEIESSLGKATGESCPRVFYRDYFTKAITYIIYILTFSLLSPLIIEDTTILENIYMYETIGFTFIIFLLIGYSFTALYEAKNYQSCTSCQTGNIIGTVLIALGKTVILGLLAYFIVNPS